MLRVFSFLAKQFIKVEDETNYRINRITQYFKTGDEQNYGKYYLNWVPRGSAAVINTIATRTFFLPKFITILS